MEGDQNSDKAKPVGYKPLPYQPTHTIANEEEMEKIEKQKLQFKYTFWAMIREQNFKNKDNFDENKLIEIESVDTVSTLSFLFLSFIFDIRFKTSGWFISI